MPFTDQIDARATELAGAIDEHADLLAERTPVPIDAIVRRIGAVNAEAVRQTGQLAVTATHAVEDVARTAWTGVSDLWEATGSSVEASTDVLRGTGRRVVADTRQARSTITDRARRAGDAVEGDLRVVGRRAHGAADVLEDRTADAAQRVAKATDTAVAETMQSGATEPNRPYEKWRKGELYERAQELDIDGRSGMSKAELVRALRSA